MFVLSIIVASILCVISLIHFYWAFGGQYGIHSAAPRLLGEGNFSPPKILTFIIACLIGGLSVLAVLLEATQNSMRETLSYIGYVITLVFIIRSIGDFKYVGFVKKIYNSDFAKKDTIYYSPLFLLLGCAFFVLSKYTP